MKNQLLFFSAFIKNQKEIGSILPSSSFLVNKMLEGIDFKNFKFFAEYGPGTGCVTNEILKRCNKNAKILCFEKNKILCDNLRKNIKDKRLILINDSASKVREYMKQYNTPYLDCVISSLPFYSLGKRVKESIMKSTREVLRDNGNFVFYMYPPHFERDFKKYFQTNGLKLVLLNIPPAIVYSCVK